MDYPVRTRTGDAVIDRLVLTGWGTVTSQVTSLFTWTDNGRLWWSYTASSRLITFYRRNSTTIAGDAVCSGTVSAAGLVTLTASNTSGITGTAEVTDGDFTAGALLAPTLDSTGDVIVSYCDENDLIDAAQGVSNVLDSNSKWVGQLVRFEALILRMRLEFDGYVARKLADLATLDNRNEVTLCDMKNPRQLAPSFSNYCVAEIMERRAGADPARMQAAKDKRERAMDLLKTLTLALDYDGERVKQAEVNVTAGRVYRG